MSTLALVEQARPTPYVLDDAMIADLRRVYREQRQDLTTLFAEQGQRWQAETDLSPAQRQGVEAYVALVAEELKVNGQLLALVDELAGGTIETILAKSDAELGLEALRGGRDSPSIR